MKQNVQQLSLPVLVNAHQWSQRKIDQKDTETDRQEKERLIFFRHGEVDKKEPDSPHDSDFVIQRKKARLRVQYVQQCIVKILPTHSMSLFSLLNGLFDAFINRLEYAVKIRRRRASHLNEFYHNLLGYLQNLLIGILHPVLLISC